MFIVLLHTLMCYCNRFSYVEDKIYFPQNFPPKYYVNCCLLFALTAEFCLKGGGVGERGNSCSPPSGRNVQLNKHYSFTGYTLPFGTIADQYSKKNPISVFTKMSWPFVKLDRPWRWNVDGMPLPAGWINLPRNLLCSVQFQSMTFDLLSFAYI